MKLLRGYNVLFRHTEGRTWRRVGELSSDGQVYYRVSTTSGKTWYILESDYRQDTGNSLHLYMDSSSPDFSHSGLRARTSNEIQILKCLRNSGRWMTASDVSAICGLPTLNVCQHLRHASGVECDRTRNPYRYTLSELVS